MNRLSWLFVIVVTISCSKKDPSADLIIINTTIQTVDELFSQANAVAVKSGVILQVGTTERIMDFVGDSTKIIDLNGHFLFPGFIEGHAHLEGIGSNLIDVDLSDAKSYADVIDLVNTRAKDTPKGEWIVGRGWHQDKWVSFAKENQFDGFPTHNELSKAVPDHPVFLRHASGHAALVNERAMDAAGVNAKTESPAGGEIFKDVSGQPTGFFNETATGIFNEVLPKDDHILIKRKVELAMQSCFENGLTGFHDARAEPGFVDVLHEMGTQNELKLRMHLMLDGSDDVLLSKHYTQGPQQGLYENKLNIRSIKLYADGALGSRGAWLLEEYADANNVHGHEVTPMVEIGQKVEEAIRNGFQVCTHAIGDRANREVLDIYESKLNKYPEAAIDHRFRIEHAQHIHPDDIPRFNELGVIPAMQAIHMSSDRPWAIDRLGKSRIENGAYMWRSLIDNGSLIVNGTDAPVEPVDPMASFYASVSRKTLQGKPENGYEPAQKMTRREALKSYTIWAAYGAFMEDQVGSIELGKLADFTILDRDIMTIPEEEILATKVVMTIIGGEIVYSYE